MYITYEFCLGFVYLNPSWTLMDIKGFCRTVLYLFLEINWLFSMVNSTWNTVRLKESHQKCRFIEFQDPLSFKGLTFSPETGAYLWTSPDAWNNQPSFHTLYSPVTSMRRKKRNYLQIKIAGKLKEKGLY